MFTIESFTNYNSALELLDKIVLQQAEIVRLGQQYQTLLQDVDKLESQIRSLQLMLTRQQQLLNNLDLTIRTPILTAKGETSKLNTSFLEIVSLLMEQVFPKSLFDYKLAKISNKPQFITHDATTPKLKVATILDEFSYQSLTPEFNLLQLHPEHYKQQIRDFEPDLIFIESAWFGHEKLWKRRESVVGRPVNSLLNFCDSQKILTVFWNKEDPVDFEHFLPLAKRCDVVLTTDANCIERYKLFLSHERVYALPFAVQPRLHNPTREFLRQERCCFAGAFYEKFPKRQRDLDRLINVVAKQLPVDIYDRNFYSKDIYNPPFPARYKQYVKGTLKFKAVNRAYKAYKLAINVNTVKKSPTMFSRRVFELAASNTVILSNYSLGIRQLFGNVIFSSDREGVLEIYLRNVTKNERVRRKANLLALRQVMLSHTYEDRVVTLKSLITNKALVAYFPLILVIAVVDSEAELIVISQNFQQQTFARKQLVIIMGQLAQQPALPDIAAVLFTTKDECIEYLRSQSPDSFMALFAASDHYGKNYLQDLILATRYTEKNIIAYGKSSYFGHQQGKCKLFQNDNHYQLVDKLFLRSSIVRLTQIFKENPLRYFTTTTILKNLPMYGVDEFNYCRNITQIKKFKPEFVDDINPQELYRE